MSEQPTMAWKLATFFHKTYEELAPQFGWETNKLTKKHWGQLPKENQELMIAVAEKVLEKFPLIQKRTVTREHIEKYSAWISKLVQLSPTNYVTSPFYYVDLVKKILQDLGFEIVSKDTDK